MPATARLRALVVDDDQAMLAYVARVLTGGGYETATASDGDDALRLCDEQPPFDVYVVDLMMPRMRGDELGRRLRLREPDVKVLYFTGYSDRLFAERQLLWEHEAFLEKPVTENGLLEAVSLLLFGNLHGQEQATL